MPEKGAKPNVHPLQRVVLRALSSLSSSLLPDDYIELVNPLSHVKNRLTTAIS
jgi:stearoyl-CoA 9-desaturase NADPH oxidoreductase